MKYKICIDTKQERYVLVYKSELGTAKIITTKLLCRKDPVTEKRAGFSLSMFRAELKRIRRDNERRMQRRSERFI